MPHSPKSPRLGSRLVHDHYLPFLFEIDRRIGRAARVELQERYDFLNAWIYDLTPARALAEALDDLERRGRAQ
jgi:hypothetical protein